MKQKVGTLIEEDIMKHAKRRAVEEGRSISDLIQDALLEYLHKKGASPKERKMAYHLFCERPMKIPPEELRNVLEEDMWDLGPKQPDKNEVSIQEPVGGKRRIILEE